MMEEPLVILPNRTNQLTVWFARNAELTVDTDPPDAVVQWPLGLSRSSARTEARTPFTQRFQSGPFGSRRASRATSSSPQLRFQPAVSHLLRLELTRSPFPLRGENWTNSHGHVIPWVAPLSNWACATETRVSDFRRFTEAPDMTLPRGCFLSPSPASCQPVLPGRTRDFRKRTRIRSWGSVGTTPTSSVRG